MSHVNRYNGEGYADPTTYEALTRIEREAKKTAYRPLVFISSPYAGDIGRNTERARGYCRFAVSKNCIPIAPHLLYPQFMDEDDPAQRAPLSKPCAGFGFSSRIRCTASVTSGRVTFNFRAIT